MKVTLFSPLLIVLMGALLIKASQVVSRIEEQTNYTRDTTVSSILVDTAYAQDSEENKAESAPDHIENTKPTKEEKKKSEHTKPEHAEEKGEEKSEEKGDHKPAADPAKEPVKTVDTASPLQQLGNNLSASEVKLLKELSKRRQELDKGLMIVSK